MSEPISRITKESPMNTACLFSRSLASSSARLCRRGISLTLAGLLTVILGATSFAAPSGTWRAAAEGSFRVEALTLARRVEHRRPVDVGDHFKADGQRVYAFLRIMNKGATQRVRVVWHCGGRVYHRSSLVVKRGPAWRTWAFISARRSMVGAWEVTVEDASGKTVARKAFVIER
ncbi:MAG: DUF2914 domain-containing protein [Lentisphaeria bacterium]|nr:DUF2914 domain-containing protein [Lentisphaeria bacterium]